MSFDHGTSTDAPAAAASKDLTTHRFFAACAKSLEGLVRDELIALGAEDVRETIAGVHFSGPLEIAYRACLYSRMASRIVFRLGEFPIQNQQDLYDAAYSIDWSRHMDPRGTLAVDAHGHHPEIPHTQFAAQRVKDAVVDQCRAQFDVRPNVELEEPDIRISLVLERDKAIFGLDLSGSPLHRRGYRIEQGEAPIKENLAAAMLTRAKWLEIYANGGGLLDPMCGSGTILIEAAWMAADFAPGLQRTYFGFLGWKQHDTRLWKSLHDEARARADLGLKNLREVIVGFDIDGRAIARASANAQRAGVSGLIRLEKHDIAHMKWPSDRPGDRPATGLVISNPPYGERLGEQSALRGLYQQMGAALKAEFGAWRAAIITPDAELGFAIGMKANKRHKLYNGAMECQLLIFEILAERPTASDTPRQLDAGQQALANRLQKNLKQFKKWRERESIECYRLYDADMPEYAAALDVYGDHLHIQEYAAPATIPDDIAAKRFRDIVRVAAQTLELPRDRIAIKERRRGKGGSKYGRMDERDAFFIVQEAGLKFEVNLFDYLDTGLFLDHRLVRARVRELARNKRVLNLFCYTGAASVYAASGSARETVSVDLSATYLDWADRNLRLNGFTGREHRLVQSDVMKWLANERSHYDVIFVDPPTFSNSKSAADFDVQRDQLDLLHACRNILAKDGVILFSNNNRRFKLDASLSEAFQITATSKTYLPPDFARNPRIHQSFELRLK